MIRAVWINIRPQLEETIRLRKRKRAREEIARIRLEREESVCNLFEESKPRLLEGKGYFASLFSVDDLVVLPEVKTMIEDHQAGDSISPQRWGELEDALPSIMAQQGEAFVQDSVAKLVAARQDLFGLDAAVVAENDRSLFGVDLLCGASAFFNRKGYPSGVVTFVELVQDNFVGLSQAVSVSEIAVLTAEVLLWELGYETTPSAEDLNLKGDVFGCVRCSQAPLSMTWTSLVRFRGGLISLAVHSWCPFCA